jgi:Ala-tRNA(Pro) deacylase
MPSKKLKEFLDNNKIKFISIQHSKAYTSTEIAASAHIPGKELAKTVLVKLNGKMVMAVIPASHKLKLELLQKAAGCESARLALEEEFKDKFPDCEIGAMPPFGNLYNIEVFVSDELAEDEEIAFNAGTHTELIRLGYKDFERLVNPKKITMSVQSKL